MSRVLPILFNTEMVQAILEGRKDATRRILKLPSCVRKNKNDTYTLFAEGTCYENQSMESILPYLKAPYQPGYILYVRETWCSRYDGEKYFYLADKCTKREEKRLLDYGEAKWRPSIHMPKEAARIFLKVKDVRVERLQDITEKQAETEGINGSEALYDGYIDAREKFAELWDSTIKKSDMERYSWSANPWVWVIEFERCEKPEE